METWKINLSNERQIRDHYIKEGRLDIADSVEHTTSKYEGFEISLLTLEGLLYLKKNQPSKILISIFGEEIKASDMDEDTRRGYVAAGNLIPLG